MVSLMNRAGGSAAFGRWAQKKIKTRVGAQLSAIALGILIFIDDYFNCLTVGSVMRPVTDSHKVSRAKLSYPVSYTHLLHILLGEKEYKDGKDITPDQIYSWSDANKTTPKTSAPALSETIDLFRPYVAVSYTHLDVYKRQIHALFQKQDKTACIFFIIQCINNS